MVITKKYKLKRKNGDNNIDCSLMKNGDRFFFAYRKRYENTNSVLSNCTHEQLSLYTHQTIIDDNT